MLKKILLLVPCLIILYLVTVFMSPKISSTLEWSLWVPGTTEKIQQWKEKFDDIVTNVPSREEFKSWALDISNTLKGWLDTTKEKIDNVRSTLSWAQDGINETFDKIDTAVETVKDAKESIEKIKNPVENLGELRNNIKSTVGWIDSQEEPIWSWE